MRPSLTQIIRGLNTSAVKIHFYNSEQEALQQTTHRLVEETINPDWEVWEREKIFPGKKVFKKFGDAGLLGIHRPTEYGGQGLGYKYHVAFLEALGHAKSSGAVMALAVQTDMSTPALANFGSEKLKE